MLNSQYNSNQFNDWWLNPWTSIDSWIIEAKLWPDINASKYVFFQMDWTQIIKKINLADFFDREDNLGIHFLDDNIRDLPNKEITQYSNPFTSGWKVINQKFPDKQITLKLKVVASSHYSLEATLTDLKTRFDYGGQLQINENWYLVYLDVYLNDFVVNAEWWLWNTAEIEVEFLTVTPIKKSALKSINHTNQTWDNTYSISILDSQKDIIPEFLLLIKEVTWTITAVNIDYNWYNIKYTWPLVEWDELVFDGKKWECRLNWVESNFDNVITNIEAWKQTILNLSFEWWTPNYSFYILYNNLSI